MDASSPTPFRRPFEKQGQASFVKVQAAVFALCKKPNPGIASADDNFGRPLRFYSLYTHLGSKDGTLGVTPPAVGAKMQDGENGE